MSARYIDRLDLVTGHFILTYRGTNIDYQSGSLYRNLIQGQGGAGGHKVRLISQLILWGQFISPAMQIWGVIYLASVHWYEQRQEASTIMDSSTREQKWYTVLIHLIVIAPNHRHCKQYMVYYALIHKIALLGVASKVVQIINEGLSKSGILS